MKKEFIRLSGILCAITLVASLLLAGVNHITAPQIAKGEAKASREAMKKILPEAETFEEIEENVYRGIKDGNAVGFCTRVSTNGYGGAIEMMVALDMDQKISGIEILSHSETAGLGAKATEPDFKKQFEGKSTPLTVVKGEETGANQVSAITGATVTSRAVAEQGIGIAKDRLSPYFEQETKESLASKMYEVVPGATGFEKAGKYTYIGKNDKKEIIGYCVTLALASEYSRFDAIVGTDPTGKVTDIIIMNHSDSITSYDKLSEAAKSAIFENTIMELDEVIKKGGENNAENN